MVGKVEKEHRMRTYNAEACSGRVPRDVHVLYYDLCQQKKYGRFNGLYLYQKKEQYCDDVKSFFSVMTRPILPRRTVCGG